MRVKFYIQGRVRLYLCPHITITPLHASPSYFTYNLILTPERLSHAFRSTTPFLISAISINLTKATLLLSQSRLQDAQLSQTSVSLQQNQASVAQWLARCARMLQIEGSQSRLPSPFSLFLPFFQLWTSLLTSLVL